MKQAILELINRKIDGLGIRDYGDRSEIELMELRSEIENIDEWIPVSERFPTDDKSVIFTDGRITGEGYVEEGYFYWAEDEYCGYDVTHWMPIPLPPNN